MPAQAAPARAGNRNHPTRRLRRIDAPGPIHRGIRAGQPGCPRDRFLSIGQRLTFLSAANKRWKTTLWPCSSPDSCPANPWTPSPKAGSGQPRSGARSRNREGTPLPNFWISEQDKTIQSCYPTLQWRIGIPAIPTSYANSGQRRPIRPRAARLATGLQTCGSRLRKNTRDPHLPVMRVTMATTLHSGVYPPPGASRWLNRANPPASICRAPRSSLPSEKWAVL